MKISRIINPCGKCITVLSVALAQPLMFGCTPEEDTTSEQTDVKISILEREFKSPQNESLTLDSILQNMNVKGFALIRDGNLLAQAYYGGHKPESKHRMFSVTKSMVGLLTGVLVGDGSIDPEKEISFYLPELKGAGMGSATVQNALDMTASLVWNNNHLDPKADVHINGMAGGMRDKPENFPYRNTLEFVGSLSKKNEHGVGYHYNPSNTEVLGWIVTRVSGRNWQEVFRERIWSRLGAKHDFEIVVDEDGHGFATAGISATLGDMAKFGQMVLEKGSYNGHQIVPADWITGTYIGSDDARDAWGVLEVQEAEVFGTNAFYHNQYRVLDSDKGVMIAFGAMGQLVYTNASEGIVAVFQSGAPIQDTHIIGKYQLDLMNQISQYLRGG